jgi:pimeloyl-ACP methyl ester carboxylesterase
VPSRPVLITGCSSGIGGATAQRPPVTRAALRLAAALVAALAFAALAFAAPPAAQAFTLRVTGPANAPRMVFDGRMSMSAVCLPVTNPAGARSLLYGQRFTDGPVTAATPAIVLVHGIASSTLDWDFSPTWSVARALASAGYVVFSYDRLGYDKSSYLDHAGGGDTLTTAAHRAMLHDVVGDVKSGGYGVSPQGDCSATTGPAGMTNQKVVVIGHSAGGWVVAGYPGTYHDVAAMVQADISGSAGGSASSPLGGSSSGGAFTPDPSHPDYSRFFQTTQDCLAFNTDPPGAVAYVAQIACTPPFLDSPYGEIADLPAMYAQNDAAIAQIGPSIPVLLTSGEQDTTDPPSSAAADLAYYQAHCGCDVSQLLLPHTGHLFQAHASLPTWVDHVVNWLAGHGVTGTPAPARASCPAPSGRLAGRTLGPVTLGSKRARVRRALPRYTTTANHMDRFCLTGGGVIRVGYPSAKLLRGLPPRQRAHVAQTVILALTANRHYALRGVRPGTRLTAAVARLHPGQPFQIGANRWYVVAQTTSAAVLRVRGGIVQEVGIASRQFTRGRAARRRLLRSFTR